MASTFLIRPVAASDETRVIEMSRAFLRETAYHDRIKEDDEHVKSLVACVREHGEFWVAVLDGRVVGMFGAILFDHPILNRRLGAEVLWWVDPDARSSGAGAKLFHVAEQWAAEGGAVGMQFSAYRDPVLERLYRRLGYHPFEVVFYKEFVPCEGTI